MDPITMMVASVGIQFFNNYATNKKTKELQARQREFQTAVTNGEFERMRKAQAAAAKLTLELEEDVHKQRLQEIVDNYDNVLKEFAHSFAIENWPLNVLPFIMKGESFGSLIKGTSQSINMHCILTPSNCNWFNEYFYDDLDLRVEAEMNNHWNAQSTHPIVYYGGGWNRRVTKSNGYSMPMPIDLDDIALLKNQLRQIPTMVITPYFTPHLHFRVCLWGMGKDNDAPFIIDPMQGNVALRDRLFSYDYIKDKAPELTDDFFNTTMEEFVPYLTSLIGFVTDKYFWSLYGVEPQLPVLLQSTFGSKQIKEKVHSNYLTLLHSIITSQNQENCAVYSKERIMAFYLGTKPIINKHEQTENMNLLIDKVLGIKNIHGDNMDAYFQYEDLSFMQELLNEIDDSHLKRKLGVVYENLQSQIACLSVYEENITFLNILELAIMLFKDTQYETVRITIHDAFVMVALLTNNGKTLVNDSEAPKCIILQYKNFIVADRLQIKSNSFDLTKDKVYSLYEQIKKMY